MTVSPTSPQAQRFWKDCEAGIFSLQNCRGCRRQRYPPSPYCPYCGSPHSFWAPAAGRGRLLSFATYHQDFGAGLELPYIVALVELEEGPRMISRLVDSAPVKVAIGMQLALVFREGPDGRRLPLFKPA